MKEDGLNFLERRYQVLAQSPAFEMLSAARSEFMQSPFLCKIGMIPNLMTLLMLEAYFGDEHPELRFSKLANVKGTEALEADAPSIRHPLVSLLRASKRLNPLYVILPLLFAATLCTLNAAAKITIRTPIIGAYWKVFFDTFAQQFGDPRWIRDFTLDFRPLILTWLGLSPPVALLIMGYSHSATFVSSWSKKEPEQGTVQRFGQRCLLLPQSIDQSKRRLPEFYSSGWFNIIIALPFIIGVPAAISLWIYMNLGVDTLFGYASHDQGFYTRFVIIGLYLFSLGWCLSALFFRSYFSYWWNFNSLEYDIEIYPDMIKRLAIKGWFYDFLMLCSRQPPHRIRWSEVKSITFSSTKLSTQNRKSKDPWYTVLGKVTTVWESVARKMDINPDYLTITAEDDRRIDIRLWELSAGQKLELFQALREYCPSVFLDENVQHALVGSTVMREPQYTQIWFAVLTGNDETNEGDLACDLELQAGAYRVKSKIASGGQAVVYSATTTSGEPAVLKEFRLTTGESFDAKIESAKDFENESAILSQLSHEGIVKMNGMFYENGRVYIVMDRVEGKSLRDVVSENGPLSGEAIQDLAIQMCRILAYLHSLEPPVVHRDFTPDNIILQPNGQLKLIDFSIALRKAKREADCAGKHNYTPPEQFRGEACPQSDIYAMGGTLYFLATGADPLPISVATLPPERADEMPNLNRLISSCTQLDLEHRSESAQWILTELLAERHNERTISAQDTGNESLLVPVAATLEHDDR